MTNDPKIILVVIAMILAVVGIIKPSWPTVAVAVLLLSIAMLIGK